MSRLLQPRYWFRASLYFAAIAAWAFVTREGDMPLIVVTTVAVVFVISVAVGLVSAFGSRP